MIVCMREPMSPEVFREEVCVRCPGSLWGERSICRIHQKSIGQIEHCPEWKEDDSLGRRRGEKAGAEKDEDAGWLLSAKPELVEQMEDDLKDYPWMVREIERLRRQLEEAGIRLTGTYGLEAALPKAKGAHADPVLREAQKREKQWRRLRHLEARTARIERAAEAVRDDRMRTVLEWLMEGQRMSDIARHIGVSRQRLHELKRELVRRMAEAIDGDEAGTRS